MKKEKYGAHFGKMLYFSMGLFFVGLLGVGSAWAQNVFPANGNVGIGTTAPAAALHLSRPGGPELRIEGAASAYLSFYEGGTSFGGIYTGNDDITLHSQAGHDIRFDDATGTKMFLKEGGNVGIGTVNPRSKLAVNGTITAKEVLVDIKGWADYVFDEGYVLLPLSELEKRIQEKGHLPGLPSAEQLAKEGLSLGQMQSKLLEKIEELTLYVIALEKEVQSVKSQK